MAKYIFGAQFLIIQPLWFYFFIKERIAGVDTEFYHNAYDRLGERKLIYNEICHIAGLYAGL